jgi:hypothetical protein
VDDIRGAERGCHFTYRCDGPGSLYNRANGYSYDAEKIFCDKNGKVTRVPYVEHVPPDVTACIFWLNNRDPARAVQMSAWERSLYQRGVGYSYDAVKIFMPAGAKAPIFFNQKIAAVVSGGTCSTTARRSASARRSSTKRVSDPVRRIRISA